MAPRTKFRLPVVLAFVAFSMALALPACGDDDGGAPSQEDFAAEADAICSDADKKQVAIKSEEQGGPYNNFDNPTYLKDWSEVTKDAIAELEQVEPSEESEDAFDDML